MEEVTERQQLVSEFADSLRGRYILSQALFYGIRELEKVPPPLREISNLADMQFLRDTAYRLFVNTDNLIEQLNVLASIGEELTNEID